VKISESGRDERMAGPSGNSAISQQSGVKHQLKTNEKSGLATFNKVRVRAAFIGYSTRNTARFAQSVLRILFGSFTVRTKYIEAS